MKISIGVHCIFLLYITLVLPFGGRVLATDLICPGGIDHDPATVSAETPHLHFGAKNFDYEGDIWKFPFNECDPSAYKFFAGYVLLIQRKNPCSLGEISRMAEANHIRGVIFVVEQGQEGFSSTLPERKTTLPIVEVYLNDSLATLQCDIPKVRLVPGTNPWDNIRGHRAFQAFKYLIIAFNVMEITISVFYFWKYYALNLLMKRTAYVILILNVFISIWTILYSMDILSSSGYIPFYLTLALNMQMLTNLLLITMLHGILVVSFVNVVAKSNLLFLNNTYIYTIVYMAIVAIFIGFSVSAFITPIRVISFRDVKLTYQMISCVISILVFNVIKGAVFVYRLKPLSQDISIKRLIGSTLVTTLTEVFICILVIISVIPALHWVKWAHLLVAFGSSILMVVGSSTRRLSLKPIMEAFPRRSPMRKHDRYLNIPDELEASIDKEEVLVNVGDDKVLVEQQANKYIKAIESIIYQYNKNNKSPPNGGLNEMEMAILSSQVDNISNGNNENLVKSAYCDNIIAEDDDIFADEE